MTDRADGLAMEQDRPPFYREPTFAQRISARLVDLVVLVPVSLLVGALADDRGAALLGLTLSAAYEVTLVATRGQTLGKMAVGTQVVDCTTGSVPGVGRAAVRWLTVVAGSLVALVITSPTVDALGGVWSLVVLLPILRPPLHRGLHDVAARTVVTVIDG